MVRTRRGGRQPFQWDSGALSHGPVRRLSSQSVQEVLSWSPERKRELRRKFFLWIYSAVINRPNKHEVWHWLSRSDAQYRADQEREELSDCESDYDRARNNDYDPTQDDLWNDGAWTLPRVIPNHDSELE